MYSAQLTISRIQSLIKAKGLTQKSVLESCGINENTLVRMTDKKGMGSFNLAIIADTLDCTVDYLLGRSSTVKNVDVGLSPLEAEILAAFRQMSRDDQLRLIGRAEILAEQENRAS